MLTIHPGPDDHEKFRKLSALAVAGCLAPLESVELQAHLKHCPECYEVFRQFQVLTTQGMMALIEECAETQQQANWDTTPVLEHILARVRTDLRMGQEKSIPTPVEPPATWRGIRRASVWLPIAAGLVLALTFSAYHLGVHSRHTASVVQSPVVAVDPRFQALSEEKKLADAQLAEQTRSLEQVQADRLAKEADLAKVRAALRDLEERANKLAVANVQSQNELAALTQQRNSLTAQLQSLTQASQSDKAELALLRSERDGMLLRASSLESKILELAAANREQERKLKDSEQYLSSDRDIRELMGARKLYIADVFDVDGSSRTQKPFGRVFYTKGKSLIFYAFDLDRQPKVVNASTFQVWGQREAPQGEQALPMNLGILYLDSEANRRWVMRFDDPKQLAEIDAVFVTVEPRGGSQKPTSKPLLYALLRNEVNHP